MRPSHGQAARTGRSARQGSAAARPSAAPLGIQPDPGTRLDRDLRTRRAVVDLRVDRRGRELAGQPGRRRAGVRVGFGGEHDLARPPGGVRALRRAPRRVRRDDPAAADGVAECHVGHRRAGSERVAGDQLGEGGPRASRLQRLRPPHRRRRRDLRIDRRRRPRPRGVPTAALHHLEAGGIIVFDNTMRRRYRRAIAAAPVVETAYRGLTPTLPYPDQTSILRRLRPVEGPHGASALSDPRRRPSTV